MYREQIKRVKDADDVSYG
ncbi:hypothetical protein JTE90_006715, partial [Oedothorax gibbosus]